MCIKKEKKKNVTWNVLLKQSELTIYKHSNIT